MGEPLFWKEMQEKVFTCKKSYRHKIWPCMTETPKLPCLFVDCEVLKIYRVNAEKVMTYTDAGIVAGH